MYTNCNTLYKPHQGLFLIIGKTYQQEIIDRNKRLARIKNIGI
ncbi:hypothetical protein VPHF99_0157 [Vibrio phage F99]